MPNGPIINHRKFDLELFSDRETKKFNELKLVKMFKFCDYKIA